MPAGWRYIDEIKTSNVESNIIFIAMRFTEELLKYCDDFIEPAIRNAGYDPLRIDKHIHDRIIVDEKMRQEIRETYSELVKPKEETKEEKKKESKPKKPKKKAEDKK